MKSIFIFMKSIFRIRSLLMDSRTILLQFQSTDRVHKQEDNIRWSLALDIPLTKEDFLWKDRERTTNRQNHPDLRPTQNGFCGYDGEDPYPEQFQLIYWFICMCHHTQTSSYSRKWKRLLQTTCISPA